MRVICLFALACGCIGAAAAATPASPIAPSASGELQCTAPDTLKKTCQSIATYKVAAKGGIETTVVTLVSQSPAVVMTTTSHVSIRSSQVCSPTRPEDIAAAGFTVDGKPATDNQATTFRTVMTAAMAGAFGQVVCTAFVPGSGGLTTQVTINGAPQPNSQRVLWVAPADGYKVAP